MHDTVLHFATRLPKLLSTFAARFKVQYKMLPEGDKLAPDGCGRWL